MPWRLSLPKNHTIIIKNRCGAGQGGSVEIFDGQNLLLELTPFSEKVLVSVLLPVRGQKTVRKEH
jgi:hypothetical protein